LIDFSTNAVLFIQSWMGRSEVESSEMELEHKTQDVVEDVASVSDVQSIEF
jgi:hypothetical protein